jgi:hypothetical protein
MKKAFSFLAMAILGGAVTLGGYKLFFNEQVVLERTKPNALEIIQTNYSPTSTKRSSVEATTDFTIAAERTVHAVVHVKNTAIRTQKNPWSELFYGNGSGTRKYEQVS